MTNDTTFFNESVTSFDEDYVAGVVREMSTVHIAGMGVINRSNTDDSWEVESYANDSVPLTRLRLQHLDLGYGAMDGDNDSIGASSLGAGSAAQNFREQLQQRSALYGDDEDDWTIQSDCNDSIGLANNRFVHVAEQRNHVPAMPATSIATQTLARITRRRASMGDFVTKEHLTQTPAAPQQPKSQAAPRPGLRRMSMSSVVTTSHESLSSHASSHASGNSDDPAGGSGSIDSSTRRRSAISRTKSMPCTKSPLSTTVPLWPQNQTETPRQKMTRRSSNGCAPCAA